MSQMESVTVDGSPMDVYVGIPSGSGPHPAVIVAHHRGGIDDFTKDRVDKLAAAGFAAAAPDLFHRTPKDADSDTKMANRKDPEIKADVNATVELLKGKGEVDGGKIAIMGHCMGGRVAFLGASTNPAITASIIYYSGNMFTPLGVEGPSPFDELKGLNGPVIGFFGNEDQNPSPDDVKKLSAELDKLGKPHEFHAYDGAGHAFQNFLAPSFRPEAEKDSWEKTLAFLGKQFK